MRRPPDTLLMLELRLRVAGGVGSPPPVGVATTAMLAPGVVTGGSGDWGGGQQGNWKREIVRNVYDSQP